MLAVFGKSDVVKIPGGSFKILSTHATPRSATIQKDVSKIKGAGEDGAGGEGDGGRRGGGSATIQKGVSKNGQTNVPTNVPKNHPTRVSSTTLRQTLRKMLEIRKMPKVRFCACFSLPLFFL